MGVSFESASVLESNIKPAVARVQTNAYRTLGLSARATWSEIQSAAAAITRGARLGRSDASVEANARAAVGALNNPFQRIQQRLFWFHGDPSFGHSLTPQTLLAPTEIAHDQALLNLEVAYSTEGGATAGILSALRQWDAFVSHSDYLGLSLQLERDGGFEPAAIASEFASLQAHAVEYAAEDLARAAVNARDGGDFATLHLLIAALKALEDTGSWAAEVIKRLIAPMIHRFADARSTLEHQYRTQVAYEDDAAKHNEEVCLGELQYYRTFIEPAWKNIAMTLTENDVDVLLARGQASSSLSDIAVDQTWAERFLLAEELAFEAATLASGTPVENRIRQTHADRIKRAESRRSRVSSALDLFHARFPRNVAHGETKVEASALLLVEELKFYRSSIEPALNELLHALLDDKESTRWRELAAACLSCITTDFICADEFTIAEGLAKETLALSQGTETSLALQEAIAKAREQADLQRRRRSAERLAESAIEHLQSCFHSFASTLAGTIITKQGNGDHTRRVCGDELNYFRTQVEPALNRVVQLLSPENSALVQLRGEVALCLSTIAEHHTCAEEFVIAERLIQEALRLAHGTQAAPPIQVMYLTISRAAYDERSRKSIKGLASVACRRTFGTVGLIFDGRSDFDKDTTAFVTTRYFTVLDLLVFPVGRYRVIQDKKQSGSYLVLSELPFRPRDYWHTAITFALAAIIMTHGLSTAKKLVKPSTSKTPRILRPSASPVTQRASKAPPAQENEDNAELQPGASSHPGTRSFAGQVPPPFDPLKVQARSRKRDVEDLRRQLRSLHGEIELLKKSERSGIPIDAGWYNAKVDAYNKLLRTSPSFVLEVKSKVYLQNQGAEPNPRTGGYKQDRGNVQ